MKMNKLSICFLAGAIGLSGCSGASVEQAERRVRDQDDKIREQSGTIHGNDKGFVLFSTRDDDVSDTPAPSSDEVGTPPAQNGSAFANPYLWQASLESLDFLPLAQADSRGGVIISDWYAPPETPSERFKVTVYILDPNLRPDALKVAVFRQVQNEGAWQDAAVDRTTVTGLEDNILKRARELRIVSEGTG